MKVNPKKVAFQNIRLINNLSNTDHDTFLRKRGGLIDPINSNPSYQLALFENNITKKARIFFKCSLSKKYLQRIK